MPVSRRRGAPARGKTGSGRSKLDGFLSCRNTASHRCPVVHEDRTQVQGAPPRPAARRQSFLAFHSKKAKRACRRHARIHKQHPHPYGGMIRIRFLGRSRTSSQRLSAPHWIFGGKSVPFFGTPLLSTDCSSLSIPIFAVGDQYFRSSRSTISPMTPSSQWHSSLAPQSFTSWAQLAGAKGMADRAIIGMSFWLSPTQ